MERVDLAAAGQSSAAVDVRVSCDVVASLEEEMSIVIEMSRLVGQ